MIGFYNYTVWLTYLSLISGTCGISIALIAPDKVVYAILCLGISGICDMFDGKVARTKKNRTAQEKAFGIQIDSLTDLVAFGVLPAIIFIALAQNAGFTGAKLYYFIPLTALFVLLGMIRLAYFNVLESERQSQVKEESTNKYFWGMPITMSSFFLPLAYIIGSLFKDSQILLYIYGVTLFIIGLLFVAKIKVPKKTGHLYSIIVVAIAILLLVSMFVFKLFK